MVVTAVIPTRGDVDLSRIRQSLNLPEIGQIIIRKSANVWGRYQGIAKALHSVVYTQDDDCVIDVATVLAAYKPGTIINAMTPGHAKCYPGAITLIGLGAVFDKSLISFLYGFKHDAVFRRECDRVFTALVPHETIFPEIEILPCATAPNRLCNQPWHEEMRDEIMRRIYEYKARCAK